ncbi:glycophorin binding protein, partial [Plasmodium reichenowi]
MRISKGTNIKSTGLSNCKNCSKYSLMEVQKENEKKRSLSAFNCKNFILIFGIIYVALL